MARRASPRRHGSKASGRRGICGAAAILSLAGAAVGALGGLGSCSTRDVVVDHPVQVYIPEACGDPGNARVSYTGLGDFQPTSDPTEVVPFGSVGFALAQSPATREIVLAPVTDAGPWLGAAFVPDAGDLNLLALPPNRACHLSLSIALDGNAGATLGLIDPAHALLLGGSSGAIPPFLVDLGTGVVTQLPSAPSSPRNYASITAYAGGVLVAGGEAMLNGGEVQDTAYSYTPGVGGTAGTFGELMALRTGQREKHAAVALPDGRVVLVGGVTGGSLAEATSFVTAVEVLDPSQLGPADAGAPSSLEVGRANPWAFVLPTGQLVVGGGLGLDGAPVTTLEWLSLPGLAPLGSVDLCHADAQQGFAPTEEGAVLVVMGGAATAGCSNVHLVRPPVDGASPVVEEAPALDTPPGRVNLFQGAQASPVLVTDTSTLRWDPWTARFHSLGAAASGLSLPTAASLSASSGLALWLGEDDHLWALRFDTRGTYATDVVHPTDLDTDPTYTAPDRLAGQDVSFAPAEGGRLAHGASIFVTDATYLDVTATVTLLEKGGVTFLLRSPTGQETSCTATDVPATGTVTLVRSGSTLSLRVGEAAPSPCATSLVAGTRVAIGLRAPAGGRAALHALTVTR